MAQAVRKKNSRPSTFRPSTLNIALSGQALRHLKEVAFIALMAVALFVLTALLSYHPSDPAWSHTGTGNTVANQGGVVGAMLADVLRSLFGYFAYVIPAMIAFSGWLLFQHRQEAGLVNYFQILTRTVGLLLIIAVGSGLVWVHLTSRHGLSPETAGIVGNLVGQGVTSVFGRLGGTLLMIGMFLGGITLFTGLSWLWLMDTVGRLTIALFSYGFSLGNRSIAFLTGFKRPSEADAAEPSQSTRNTDREDRKPLAQLAPPPPPVSPPAITTPPRPETGKRREQGRLTPLPESPDPILPPLSLLDTPPSPKGGYPKEILEAMSRQVEAKLQDFGIAVAVVGVHPGPVITRFELEPAPGIKASRITGLSRDLARSLSTISVRVVEVIPGKSVIGLEIPNKERELVSLREILGSSEYQANHSPLTIALGKDISGKPYVADLTRMPHLLVAGTTGAGKSVALNAMILSLLFKAPPKDVRLIMIDPKMLELSVYEGVPSLLAPVVTDMKEAANALRWCVAEMERRYQLMASQGVRNIGGYNHKVREAAERGEPLSHPFQKGADGESIELPHLPYIVVIVDELADMMMTVGKKVEELIARLAQKARAAGIHLILATQRPSVDVITGLIKANIPSRIAFQVSSRVDSRTILDQMGAESLLGHGDMLYLPPGTGLPIRVHGAFVSDQEVHKVVGHLKHFGEPDYIDEIISGPAEDEEAAVSSEPNDLNGETDPLYDEAVKIVTETRRASISSVQRRLKIGYNRAARMIEDMERAGVVGSLQSNGSREVLAPPPPKD
jgi:S-DNA-T family DNA segregation ATPase FtsK/SpoIIIE